MKHFLLKISGFFLFFISFLLVLYFIIPSPENMNSRLKQQLKKISFSNHFELLSPGRLAQVFIDAENLENMDILFLGSSRTIRAYDPRFFRQYGYESINLGSRAQSPLNTHYLLRDVLTEYSPGLFVYDIFPEMFHSDGKKGSKTILINIKNSINYLPMVIRSLGGKTILAYIVSHLNTIRLKNYKYKDKDPTRTYITGGYYETYQAFDVTEKVKTYQNPPFKFQFDIFEKTLKLVNDKGINCVIVASPSPKVLLDACDDYDEIINWIRLTTQRYNVPFFDFSNGIYSDTTYFYDPYHLNKRGVEVYLPSFYDSLQTTGFLK